MQKHDKVEKELKKLPSFDMDPNRKRKNLHEIRMAKQGGRKEFFMYPLTIVVFMTVVFLGFLILSPENNEKTSISEKQDRSELQTYFEDTEPIYSNSHIPNTVEFPDKYDKGVAIGYLYNAAIFVTPDGQKINPLENEKDVNSHFDYSEEEIEKFEKKAKVDNWLGDTKPTWVYLGAANQQIKDEKLSAKLKELEEQVMKIKSHETIQHNFDIYRNVSIELAAMVREISKVTSPAPVYEGESSEWFMRVQPLSEENYFLYLHSKNEQNLGQISISSPNRSYQKTINLKGSAAYNFGVSFPEELLDSNEMDLVLKMKEKTEMIKLQRKNRAQIDR